MVKKIIQNLEEILASGFIIFTTLLVLVNIFMRYFLKTGIPWSEEVATTSFVWAVFIGAAAAYKRNQHIGIDILVKRFGGIRRETIQIVADLIMLCIMVFIAILSIQYIQVTYRKPTPVLAMSSAWISSAIPVGFILMVIRSVQKLISDCRIWKEGRE